MSRYNPIVLLEREPSLPSMPTYKKMIDALHSVDIPIEFDNINIDDRKKMMSTYELILSNKGETPARTARVNSFMDIATFLQYQMNMIGTSPAMIITSARSVPSSAALSSSSAALFSSILNSSLNNYETQRDPVDQNTVNRFTVTKYDDLRNHMAIDVSDTCTICMCEYKDESDKRNEKIMILPCEHHFHEECIKKYLLEYSYKCPICRQSTMEYGDDDK